MIHLLLTRAHGYTLQQYLDTWGRDVRGILAPRFYDDLAFGSRLDPGTWIFGDLERLDEAHLDLARAAWDAMAARQEEFMLLNDPRRVLRRFELLRALHAAGVNRFAAHRLGNGALPKFPVFLRHENEHDGALSPLLHSAQELDRAAEQMTAAGAVRADLLAIEYCDTADSDGIYRKYSAFRVGDRIIARHVLHSRKWVLKTADLIDDNYLGEERDYLATNPHEDPLRRIFDLAHIQWGRIDYSLLDGAVQVWEINTNPMIVVAPHRIAPGRLVTQAQFARDLHAALTSVDLASTAPPLRFRVDRALARRLGITRSRHVARQLAKAFAAAAKRLQPPPAAPAPHH